MQQTWLLKRPCFFTPVIPLHTKKGGVKMFRNLNRKWVLFILGLLALLAVSVIPGVRAIESSAPLITAVNPAEGGAVNNPNTAISFTVYDPDLISGAGYYIKLNGSSIPSDLQYRGHWESDRWDEWYVVDSYNEATISGTVSGLKDGSQNVEVRAVDSLGNAVVKTWAFNVAAKPVFSNMTPALGSFTANNTSLSVKVTDNDQVDPATIVLTVDNLPVQHAYDPLTGLVTYTAAPPLPDGLHIIGISAGDMAGNQASETWSYTVWTAGPQLNFADAGKSYATASPALSVGAKSNLKLDSNSAVVAVDGNATPAVFTYKGHWDYPFELDPVWIIDSYNEAAVSLQPVGLKDGNHTISVTVKDILGNSTTDQWSFAVNSKPEFSSPSPANGANTTNNQGFSVKATDNDTIVPTSVAVYLDSVLIPAGFDPVTGVISAQPAAGLADGTHKVEVSAADTTGNISNFTWSYTVQTTGPNLAFTDAGKTFDTYQPALTVTLKSNVKILDAGTVMNIDGQPVAAVLTYKGHWDYPFELDPVWVVDSYNEATLTYNPASLGDGPHTISVTAKDVLNNTGVNTWNFAVAQKPLFSGIEPVDGATVNTRTPVIRVTVTDPNGPAIDKASVKLVLDANQVVPIVTDTDGGVNITYTPAPLANDSYHNAALSVADTAYNPNSAAWKFYVNTKGEMPAGAKACGSCHDLNPYDKYVHVNQGPYGFDKRNWSHMHGNNCSHCHGGYTQQFCGYCHNGNPDDFYYGTATPDPALEAGRDCTFCHSPNPTAVGLGTPSTNAVQHQVNNGVLPLNLGAWNILTHDILPLHNVDKGACNECHSTYLTREHNRISSSGIQLDCAACHNSADPTVQQAVYSKNKDCSACHAQADHGTVHTSGIDQNCTGSCHKATLTQDHTSRKDAAGNPYTCDTCHASKDKKVNRSIAAGSLNCAGCHPQGHNINLADNVPADIPLYAGFQWSTPMEASVFTGEPTTPAGYENGQVVLSNRRTDVAVSEAWDFYRQGLTSGGWILKSGAPASGAAGFAAEFVYGARAATVKYYNTEKSDGAGQPQSGGYRLEIWYKYSY